jgi:Transposase family tnp2
MKRKYIMLSLLILGPKQPGNDIDVYLAPLLEDLNKLWKDGVRIFDAYLKEYFILRAVIFCTINDFSAYGNLSGHRTKGEKACPICGEETHTIRLKNCGKMFIWDTVDFLIIITPTDGRRKLLMVRLSWRKHQYHYPENKYILL